MISLFWTHPDHAKIVSSAGCKNLAASRPWVESWEGPLNCFVPAGINQISRATCLMSCYGCMVEVANHCKKYLQRWKSAIVEVSCRSKLYNLISGLIARMFHVKKLCAHSVINFANSLSPCSWKTSDSSILIPFLFHSNPVPVRF